ncbi:MAG: type II toxin-antitoxin system HicB family antitoxin [Thaumarchaeota archaeon]|nr:type II toxin-antitoxin system HicB family antitoxin [Nitrososphaerota archaeon]
MKKNKLTFAIRNEEEGGFSAQCIEIPGIITQADTESELKEMIDDAVSGYFQAFPEEKDRLEKIKKGKIIEVAI